MPETRHTFCRICEALCGLEITLEKGEITQIRPDDDHVATQGFGCAKGLKQHKIYSSPDRLKYPLKRVGKEFVRISWDQALEEIGAKVKKIRAAFSDDSVGMYVGTAAGFGVLHPIFAQGFMTGINSKSMYASATQDCSNKFAVSRMMYGFPFTLPFPDVDNTDCLIVVGANPAISKWSFLQVSNPSQRLKDIERRGGRVFFIDPRKTESAKIAGTHIPIRPNTDVFFYLSFVHEFLATVEPARLAEAIANTSGFAALEEVVAPWSPEKTAAVTQIPADTLRELVATYRDAKSAALYCSTGVNMGTHGSLSYWLQECLNALSGNLDRRGGTLVGKGVIDFPKFGHKHGILMRDDRSRIGDFGSVNDTFPGGIMADEILTPGEKQLRGMFITGGNPLITMANSNRLREAFQDLELLVVLDIFRSETAQLAHYVLPCTSPLQRPDLPFIFPLMLGLQSRPYMQATKRILPPEGEQRDEATIYLDLARACGVSLFDTKITQLILEAGKKLHSMGRGDAQPSIPQELMLSMLLRITGQGSFRKLLKHPHGLAEKPHDEREAFLGERVLTDDGKVALAPPALLTACETLQDHFDNEIATQDKLKLISKRAVTTHNSWTHNLDEFVAGRRHTNYLYMHPEDAEKAGLQDGDLADVTSEVATVRVPIKLLEELMPRTVALPHGWGHQHAKGLSVASQTTGVNVNILAADGPDKLERVSGMAHLTGILVDVAPAAGPLAEDSWSGLPQDVF